MSFFSWMKGARQKPCDFAKPARHTTIATSPPREVAPDPPYVSMDPIAIADAVVLLRKENDRATELCARADFVIKGHEYELMRLQNNLKLQENMNSELESANRQLTINLKHNQAELQERNASLNQKSAQLLQLQHKLKVAHEQQEALQNELLKARVAVREEKYGNLYDNGMTTTGAVSVLTHHADLRPVPFVVILVDGDSYHFPDVDRAPDTRGPETAHKLHREVSKYILSHPEIPPHSKIIVRIFCNRSTLVGKMAKKPRTTVKGNQPLPKADAVRLPSATVETMVKFAETYPLFDYLDCGGGKERVDDKIRENCHLFLADSNCHTVFLAVCNDNGYGRMLERYDRNPVPSAKIVLLTNGEITQEMARLSFPKVEFNGVFLKRLKRKKAQGSSGKMGILLEASHIQGYQNASDYDLDYTDPRVQEQIDKKLNDMRLEKQKSLANAAIFGRLPYETDERYAERLRTILPFARPNLSYARGLYRSVGYVGLGRFQPSGVLPSAPVLPFLLRPEMTESMHGHASERLEKAGVMEHVRHAMGVRWAEAFKGM